MKWILIFRSNFFSNSKAINGIWTSSWGKKYWEGNTIYLTDSNLSEQRTGCWHRKMLVLVFSLTHTKTKAVSKKSLNISKWKIEIRLIMFSNPDNFPPVKHTYFVLLEVSEYLDLLK